MTILLSTSELEARRKALRVYETTRVAVKVRLENLEIIHESDDQKLRVQICSSSSRCKEEEDGQACHESLMTRHHSAWCYPRPNIETRLDPVVQGLCSTKLAEQWKNQSSLVQLCQSSPVVTVSLCLVRYPGSKHPHSSCFAEALVI